MEFYKVLASLLLVATLLATGIQAGKKKIIIHVPYRVKKLKHTHTIYKIIHHHDHGHHGGHHHDHHDHHEHHWGGHSGGHSSHHHW